MCNNTSNSHDNSWSRYDYHCHFIDEEVRHRKDNFTQGYAGKQACEPRFQQPRSWFDSCKHEDKVRNLDFHLAGPLDRFRQNATCSGLHFIVILAAIWRVTGRKETGGRGQLVSQKKKNENRARQCKYRQMEGFEKYAGHRVVSLSWFTKKGSGMTQVSEKMIVESWRWGMHGKNKLRRI